jgi:hypothetical protein
MQTSTSSILLNGVLGKVFHYKRGVRQGDPLSPLLFVFTADILQSIVNKANDIGLLKLPLQYQGDVDFPIIQYAYDTLIIMEACQRQMFVLKAWLQSFGESTSLKVKYAKSNIYPINVSAEKMDILSKTFSCRIGSFPFTYLGLPLGTSKPRIQDFLPMVNRIEKD